MLAAKIIDLARSQVGYREGYSAGHWNNDQKYSDQVPGMDWSDGYAWCQTFQSWLAWKTDSPEPRTASCIAACDWFKARDRFSYYPAVGAQVFFGPSGGSHVGRVYKYDADTIWTIEGNTNNSGSAEGNGVYLKRRARRDTYTYGYGMPDFPEGVTTADPALKGRAGYHYARTADGPETSEEIVTPEDIDRVADKVVDRLLSADRIAVPWESANKRNQVGNAWESMWRQTYRADKRTERIEAAMGAISVGGVDLDSLAAKVADLLAARLAK